MRDGEGRHPLRRRHLSNVPLSLLHPPTPRGAPASKLRAVCQSGTPVRFTGVPLCLGGEDSRGVLRSRQAPPALAPTRRQRGAKDGFSRAEMARALGGPLDSADAHGKINQQHLSCGKREEDAVPHIKRWRDRLPDAAPLNAKRGKGPGRGPRPHCLPRAPHRSLCRPLRRRCCCPLPHGWPRLPRPSGSASAGRAGVTGIAAQCVPLRCCPVLRRGEGRAILSTFSFILSSRCMLCSCCKRATGRRGVCRHATVAGGR